jgi:hypothetical protein
MSPLLAAGFFLPNYLTADPRFFDMGPLTHYGSNQLPVIDEYPKSGINLFGNPLVSHTPKKRLHLMTCVNDSGLEE